MANPNAKVGKFDGRHLSKTIFAQKCKRKEGVDKAGDGLLCLTPTLTLTLDLNLTLHSEGSTETDEASIRWR